MKYFFLKKPDLYNYDRFGSSKLGISQNNKGFKYDADNFWDYDKKITIDLYGEDKENRLDFSIYQIAGLGYVYIMIPELQSIFSQFNMPDHRWYQAEAGYDLEFIKQMKKFFKIDYSKYDLTEKREYKILQFLSEDMKDLDFSSMSFNIIDIKSKEVKNKVETQISSHAEYLELLKKIFEKTDYNDYLDSPKYIYCKNYDILWGGTHIVFNEKVKAALEASNLINYENGLEFAEFTEYEIVMLGE